MQIQLLSLHHSTNNYSKSQKLPSEVSHIPYQGAALLCPRKFLCAVSCTGHGPSQLFTISISVALAAPLRSYFHYKRCCTNTGGMWGCVIRKEPKWEKLQYCHFLYNLYFFLPKNSKEASSPLSLSRNTSGDIFPIPTSYFNVQLMRFNRSYNSFK